MSIYWQKCVYLESATVSSLYKLIKSWIIQRSNDKCNRFFPIDNITFRLNVLKKRKATDQSRLIEQRPQKSRLNKVNFKWRSTGRIGFLKIRWQIFSPLLRIIEYVSRLMIKFHHSHVCQRMQHASVYLMFASIFSWVSLVAHDWVEKVHESEDYEHYLLDYLSNWT